MACNRNLKRQHYIFISLISLIVLATSLAIIIPYVHRRMTRMQPISKFTKPDPLPKFFAIDLDDTFYTKDAESMAKNVEAFKHLISKGVTPFFATGRDLNSTLKILGDDFCKETQYYGFPGVYSNGALVYDHCGNLLKLQKFSEDFLEKFNKFVENNDLADKTVFFGQSEMYTLKPLYEEGVEFLNRRKMNQPSVISYEELLKKEIASITFPSKGFNIEGLEKNVDYQVKYCYEIIAQLSPSTCSEKDGIEILMKTLKESPDICAYIGDGYNDIEAMELCGQSFAVNNAKDEVKEHANWVVDLTADQGAFAKVVELLYK